MASDPIDAIRDAREAVETAAARYKASIFEAREAGVAVRHIARATGLTRQRIYVLLKTERERAPRPRRREVAV